MFDTLSAEDQATLDRLAKSYAKEFVRTMQGLPAVVFLATKLNPAGTGEWIIVGNNDETTLLTSIRASIDDRLSQLVASATLQ